MEPLSRNHASPFPLEVKEALQQRPPAARRATERVWHLLAEAPAAAAPSTDAAWADLARRLDEAPKPHAPRAADRRPTRRRGGRLGAVAGLLAAVILAVGTWWWMQPEVVTVPYGVVQTVTLPDGSQVQLNSGSRIAYARGFARWPGLPAGVRRVELQGEAFFDVAQDGRPFRIETASATIEVLGTRFNVRARRDAQSTQVTLEEGRVRVTAAAAGGASVVLSEAGQTVHVAMDAATLMPRVADLDRALAWRRGGFVMDDEPVAAILQELQRVFGVTIHVEGRLNLDDSLYIEYQRDAKVEDIIHDICLAQGCQYRRSSRGFTLSPSTSPGSDG